MTVRVASTSDTEAEVQEATKFTSEAAPSEETSPVAEEEIAPASLVAEAQDTEETEELEETAESAAGTDSEEEPAPPIVMATSEEVSKEEAPLKRKRRRRGRSYKDRASQLAREKAAATLRANTLEMELEKLRTQVTAPPILPAPVETPVAAPPAEETPPVEATAASTDGKPVQEQFETYDAFQEAMVDWKVNQRLEKHETQQRDRIERDRVQRAQEESVAAHTARIDTFRAAHTDFDAVIEKGKNLPLTRPMQDAVMNSESGPALMYHLCQNPEECDRIAGLHPMMAIKEMGRLEAHVEAADTGPASSAELVTKAPRPIKPVGGGATASTVPRDQLPYREYKRLRDKEEAADRGL
jgi:hypothetical protein